MANVFGDECTDCLYCVTVLATKIVFDEMFFWPIVVSVEIVI